MTSRDAEEASERGDPWSADEVDLIVADYFNMLKAELAGPDKHYHGRDDQVQASPRRTRSGP